jgi:hypothetical protein
MIEAGAKVATGDVLDERGRETATTIAAPWLPASESATVLSLHFGFTWHRALELAHTPSSIAQLLHVQEQPFVTAL